MEEGIVQGLISIGLGIVCLAFFILVNGISNSFKAAGCLFGLALIGIGFWIMIPTKRIFRLGERE